MAPVATDAVAGVTAIETSVAVDGGVGVVSQPIAPETIKDSATSARGKIPMSFLYLIDSPFV